MLFKLFQVKENSIRLFALSMLLIQLVSANWNSKVFNPYIDITLWPTPNIYEIHKLTGIQYFKLAFITANAMKSELEPAWASIIPMGFYDAEIKQIREAGGDVCVSFGGASGQELALKTDSETELAKLYQQVIDTYSLKCIDLDIEGAAIANVKAHDVRNKALNIIRKNNPNIHISYCLPVMPDGLDNNGLSILQSAKKVGFTPDTVEIMAMDYGSGKDMGDHAITATQNTIIQAKKIFEKNIAVGVIPMIGLNDVMGEVFTLDDAKDLLNFVKTNSLVKSLSMWSVSRDKTGILGQVGPTGSGITQSDYQFSKIFINFQENNIKSPWKCKKCICKKI